MTNPTKKAAGAHTPTATPTENGEEPMSKTESNVRPIWTPQDSIDTAQQFAMELANAERGQSTQTAVRGVTPGSMRPASTAHDARQLSGEVVAAPRTAPRLRLVTASRERRARLHDGLAVALLLTLCAAIGCIVVLASVPR